MGILDRARHAVNRSDDSNLTEDDGAQNSERATSRRSEKASELKKLLARGERENVKPEGDSPIFDSLSSEHNVDMSPVVEEESAYQKVLNKLGIAEKVVVPDSVMLEEDAKDVRFDFQIKNGYNVSQVKEFQKAAAHSFRELTSLVQQRNRDLIKMAQEFSGVDSDSLSARASAIAQQQVSELEEVVATQIEAEEEKREKLEQEVASLKTRVSRALKEVQDAHDTADDEAEQKEQAWTDLDKSRKESDLLNKKVDKLTEEITQLKEKIEQKDKALDEKESAYLVLQRFNEEMKQSLHIMSAQSKARDEAVEESAREVEKLRMEQENARRVEEAEKAKREEEERVRELQRLEDEKRAREDAERAKTLEVDTSEGNADNGAHGDTQAVSIDESREVDSADENTATTEPDTPSHVEEKIESPDKSKDVDLEQTMAFLSQGTFDVDFSTDLSDESSQELQERQLLNSARALEDEDEYIGIDEMTELMKNDN